MRRALAVLSLILWAGAGQAQDLPALFDVTGVAADDVLNVRLRPDASALPIGALPHDARFVEGIRRSDDGRWTLVNTGESAGWVASRFLARQPGQTRLVGRPMLCSGTEPFWSLDIPNGGPLILSMPAGPPQRMARGNWRLSENRTDTSLLVAEATGNRLTPGLSAVIARAECSDGMSDFAYGLSINLILHGIGGQRLMSGCCSLGH